MGQCEKRVKREATAILGKVSEAQLRAYINEASRINIVEELKQCTKVAKDDVNAKVCRQNVKAQGLTTKGKTEVTDTDVEEKIQYEAGRDVYNTLKACREVEKTDTKGCSKDVMNVARDSLGRKEDLTEDQVRELLKKGSKEHIYTAFDGCDTVKLNTQSKTKCVEDEIQKSQRVVNDGKNATRTELQFLKERLSRDVVGKKMKSCIETT